MLTGNKFTVRALALAGVRSNQLLVRRRDATVALSVHLSGGVARWR